MFENTYQREYHGTKAYLVMDGKNKTKDEEAKNTLILGIHIHTGQMSHSNAKLFILFLRSIFVPEFVLPSLDFSRSPTLDLPMKVSRVASQTEASSWQIGTKFKVSVFLGNRVIGF